MQWWLVALCKVVAVAGNNTAWLQWHGDGNGCVKNGL
jgi:hypothetical protein